MQLKFISAILFLAVAQISSAAPNPNAPPPVIVRCTSCLCQMCFCPNLSSLSPAGHSEAVSTFCYIIGFLADLLALCIGL